VGNGNIDVGSHIAPRQPGRRRIEHVTATDGSPDLRIDAPNAARLKRPGICGAMSLQCGDSGHVSAPQKLVQLVGYRDPRARPQAWVRPAPVKR
jgi:hypothetical protein